MKIFNFGKKILHFLAYNTWIFILIRLISISLFLLSLFFPLAYSIDRYDVAGHFNSLSGLLLGWIGVLVGYDISWLANVTYLISLILCTRIKLSFSLSVITLLFALSFLTLERRVDLISWDYLKITKLGLGYYLWFASFLVFWFGQTFVFISRSIKG